MLLRLLAAIVVLGLGGGAALACPGDETRAGAAHLSARQLATPRAAAVRAGGGVVLEACGGLPGRGHLPFAPSAVIHYTADLNGRGLEIRSEGGCRPVLLVRTPRGNWLFGESPERRSEASVLLGNPLTGRYAIWVGTVDAFGCDARLVLRTVRPTRFGLSTAVGAPATN
jgi:hypothetical protein